MDKLEITGPCELSGSVRVSSAKNACLPIIIATLLNEGKTTLNHLPDLRDMRTLKKLLERLGVSITATDSDLDGQNWDFNASNISECIADYDLVKTMRASVLVLGPLLSRFGKAKVSLPGGCAIGSRPVDIHLDAFQKMGATIELKEGYIFASAKKLQGCELSLNFPSVGATENIMMAAVYAQGDTIIHNAAREPEIVDLANFLRKLGVHVIGDGTSTITITGVDSPIKKDIEHVCIPDRIEAVTYLMAALATGSQITVDNVNVADIVPVLEVLKDMGAKFTIDADNMRIMTKKSQLDKGFEVTTSPHPGFPTDAQAQLMALGLVVNQTSILTENVFENRFMHVPELNRLGADIKINAKTARVIGGTQLKGASVMCTDLRASAALFITALCAQGTTLIDRIYHLDRGYSQIEKKLQGLGAKVRRVS